MLTHLLGLDIVGEAVTAAIVIAPEYVVTPARVPAYGGGGSAIPLGAPRWAAPFDPADRRPYAIDWSQLLDDAERLVAILHLGLSAADAELGLRIDAEAGRAPVIGDDGKAVRLCFSCAEEQRRNPAFEGAGVEIAVAARVRTDASPYKEYERTAVLTVRQQ